MTDVVKVVSQGITVSRVHVECDEYSPGMATCAKEVLDLTDSDALFMAVSYVHGKKNPYRHVSVIGRAKPVKTVDLGALLKESLKGGGHPKAASAAFRMDQPIASSDELERCRVEGDVDGILDELVRRVCAEQVPPERKASDVMRRSEKVVSARPERAQGERRDAPVGEGRVGAAGDDDGGGWRVFRTFRTPRVPRHLDRERRSHGSRVGHRG